MYELTIDYEVRLPDIAILDLRTDKGVCCQYPIFTIAFQKM